MLQGINRVGKSWVGRVIVTILFGFLIVSFAIWGIGDIFRGQVRTQVATVGKVEITADAYRNAYQAEYQNLIRRTRQTITPDQARAFGLDRQVLGRLVTEAAMDQRTRELKLTVPDGVVVQSIQADPSFRGLNGQFDRAQFNDLLRSNGLSEGQYVREQRSVAARLQLADALTGDLPVPLAMREAVHRYRTEKRAAEYVVLAPSVLGEIAAPDKAALQAFFDERKAVYRAPDYRAVNLLTLDTAELTKPDAVSDADAGAFYERFKSTRFGTQEKRTIQQIVFPNAADAEAASKRIKEGLSFEALAKERGIDDATLTLGTLAKGDMLDPAAGEAAFGLAAGAVSDPVAGRFGPVLVRVTKVEPATTMTFDQVAPLVKAEIARDRAAADLQSVHDAIEDQRAGAKPLAEIAKERGLAFRQVPAVDRQGQDKAGQPLALPGGAPLLQAVFRSDIGADNEAIRTGESGYVWFEVTGIEPARDRSLDEVTDRVTADWRADTVARRLADRARELKAKLDGGASLAIVAGEAGLTLKTASDLARSAANDDLPRTLVARIFSTPVGQGAEGTGAGETRVVFRVTSATMPPYAPTAPEAGGTEDQLRAALREDLLAEFIAEVEKQVGVATFPENMRRAIGGET